MYRYPAPSSRADAFAPVLWSGAMCPAAWTRSSRAAGRVTAMRRLVAQGARSSSWRPAPCRTRTSGSGFAASIGRWREGVGTAAAAIHRDEAAGLRRASSGSLSRARVEPPDAWLEIDREYAAVACLRRVALDAAS